MTQENLAFRLKHFIDAKGISNSLFADNCGIPKPSLSQLLSGRNKKVSDILVGQIHQAYPDLNILWLLFGEGNMMVSEQTSGVTTSSAAIGANANMSDSLEGTASGSESGTDSGFGPSFGYGSDEASLSDPSDPSLANLSDHGFGAQLFNANFDSALNQHKQENSVLASRSSGSENSVRPTDESARNFYSKENGLSDLPKRYQMLVKELNECKKMIASQQAQIEDLSKIKRKVTSLTVYYDDSTFETFKPAAE